MVLRMVRPYKHPKTGIFQFRQGVPERLRSLVGKTEEKVSLRTRDPDEAKIAHARVAAEVGQRWARLTKGLQNLSHKQAEAVAGEIYRSMVESHEDDPDQVPGRVTALMLDRAFLRSGSVRIHPIGADRAATLDLIERLRSDRNSHLVDGWLRAKGFLLDTDSRARVAAAVDRAVLQAREQLDRMAGGDYAFMRG